MAQKSCTPTKLRDGSKDKFYRFFKFHVDSITDSCRDTVRSIQLTDGTTSWEAYPGSRKMIEFQYPSDNGTTFKVKDTVKEVVPSSRTIIYEIEKGGPLGDITEVKLEVMDDDYARWTVYYNKTNPDNFLALLKSVNEAVDTYINTHN